MGLIEKLALLCHPIRGKTKANRDFIPTISRASRRLHVFDSRFDWFTGLPLSFGCGRFMAISLRSLYTAFNVYTKRTLT